MAHVALDRACLGEAETEEKQDPRVFFAVTAFLAGVTQQWCTESRTLFACVSTLEEFRPSCMKPPSPKSHQASFSGSLSLSRGTWLLSWTLASGLALEGSQGQEP